VSKKNVKKDETVARLDPVVLGVYDVGGHKGLFDEMDLLDGHESTVALSPLVVAMVGGRSWEALGVSIDEVCRRRRGRGGAKGYIGEDGWEGTDGFERW
jgi:hypothetical protein